MPEQEQKEQPKKQVNAKRNQYFWSATVYTIINRKTENVHGVVEADDGQAAVSQLDKVYPNGDRYRNFSLVALNRV